MTDFDSVFHGYMETVQGVTRWYYEVPALNWNSNTPCWMPCWMTLDELRAWVAEVKGGLRDIETMIECFDPPPEDDLVLVASGDPERYSWGGGLSSNIPFYIPDETADFPENWQDILQQFGDGPYHGDGPEFEGWDERCSD